MADATRLRLVRDLPDDDERVLKASELRARLERIPDDAAIYVVGGTLWAFPRQDNRCIQLGDPGFPDDPADAVRRRGR